MTAFPHAAIESIDRLAVDTAAEMTRRQTPAEVLERRSQKRLTIAELNSLDIETIREKFARLPAADTRPGVIRLLDIIDMPRNLAANAIARTVLPGAARRADERGEKGTFGATRITGSDLLRGLGLNNRVVTAVGGFGLDVITDPLIWLGGPIKTATVKGSQGAVRLGATGQKALRTGLKEVAAGKAVTDPGVAALFKSAGDARGIDLAGGKDAAAALSKAILGDFKAPLSRVGDAVGLPSTRIGGDIAELTFKTADNAGIARTPEMAEYIRQVGKFVDDATLNRGIRFGNPESVGTAVAHVPFTDITIYTPAWTKGGRQAVAQRAIARSQSGDPFTAGLLAEHIKHLNTLEGELNAARNLADEFYANSQRMIEEADAPIEAIRKRQDELRVAIAGDPENEIVGARQRIESQMQAIREGRQMQAQLVHDYGGQYTDLGDVLAAAEMTRELDARARQAMALMDMNINAADVSTFKKIKAAAKERGEVQFGIQDIQTILDDLPGNDQRVLAMERLVRDTMARQQGRLERLQGLVDDDLDLAVTMAEQFNRYVTASHEVAQVAREPIRATLNADGRDLVTAAARALGLDRDQIGALPFASFSSAMDRIGMDSGTVMAALGAGTARTFGGIGGDAEAARAMLTNAIGNGSADAGAQVAREFLKGGGRYGRGIEAIARDAGVPYENLDELIEVVYAMAAKRGRTPEYWATSLSVPGRTDRVGNKIKFAMERGLLKNADPALIRELEAMADAASEYIDDLGQFAVAERELNLLLNKGEYLPTSLTDDAARLLRQQQGTGLLQGSGGSGRLREAFQTPRGTTEIRYLDPETNEVRHFLEMDRKLYGGLDELDMEAIKRSPDPRVREGYEEIARIRETIRRFDELHPLAAGDNGIERSRVFGKELDAVELNELFDGGAFAALTGGVFSGTKLWETNLPKLIARRTAAHRIGEARRAFLGVVEPYAVPLESRFTGATIALKPGESITTRGGQRLEVLGSNRFRMGDTVYRPLKETKFDGLVVNPFDHLETDSANLFKALYPEQLAETMERFAEQLQPDRIEGLLRLANNVNKVWRATTLAHPSWSIGNIVGNALLLGMAVPNVNKTGARVAEAVKVVANRRNPEALSKIRFTIGEQTISGTELVQIAEQMRVLNGGHSAEVAEHMLGKIADRAAPLSRALRDFPSRLKSNYELSLAESALARKAMKKESARGRAFDRLQAGAVAFRDEVTTPTVRAWFRINGGIDDSFRLGLFMHYLDEGHDAASAASQVRNRLLNFGDLTTTEATKLRPLFPFYSWLRASGPNMLEKLVTEPRYFASLPKLHEAFEELAAGENTVPRHMRPRWLQEQLAIQWGTDPEMRSALTVGTIIPQEQALRVAAGALGAPGAIAEMFGFGFPFDGTDLMDAFDFLLSSTGPTFKTAIDLGTGRESFTGREIGPRAGEGDITLSEYLIGQIRPLKELGVGSARQGPIQRSFDEGIGTGVGRLLLGGRIQPHLQEERRAASVLREMQEKEKRIRRAIAVAEREGNKKASQSSRAALLRVYADYMTNGGDPADVPKWAREQLTEIGASIPALETVQ